jgi:hypothetical protein
MSEPTLKCRHSGQQVPYQIHQGLAPMYVFHNSSEQKMIILNRLVTWLFPDNRTE